MGALLERIARARPLLSSDWLELENLQLILRDIKCCLEKSSDVKH